MATEGNATASKAAVPAVQHAIAILRLFSERANQPATMTEIARSAGINPSTCFNILKTLEEARLVAFDPTTKSYCLGLGVVELAGSVDANRQVVQTALEFARGVADQTQLACLVVRMAETEEFVVVDKAESRRPIKVTVAVGERFPANSSVLAKAYFAWVDEAVVDRMIERLGLPEYSPNSIIDGGEFKRQLETTRSRGFATSVGEYYPDHNALAAPMFDRHGQVTHLLVIVGFAFELPAERLEAYGELLREAAEAITDRVGGCYPRLQQAPADPRGKSKRQRRLPDGARAESQASQSDHKKPKPIAKRRHQ